jgi:predicted anti-sigma-YlaC factor YlaD
MNTHYDQDLLTDYLHGALDPATDAAVFAHLEACAECRAARDAEAAIGDALRTAARAEELELPAMVRARVWEAVRRQKPTLLDRLRSPWGPAIAVPIAAAVALAAYFGTPVLRGAGTPPGIAASYYLDQHNAQATQNPLGPTVGPAVYTTDGAASTTASYIDTADAATLDNADGAIR